MLFFEFGESNSREANSREKWASHEIEHALTRPT